MNRRERWVDNEGKYCSSQKTRGVLLEGKLLVILGHSAVNVTHSFCERRGWMTKVRVDKKNERRGMVLGGNHDWETPCLLARAQQKQRCHVPRHPQATRRTLPASLAPTSAVSLDKSPSLIRVTSAPFNPQPARIPCPGSTASKITPTPGPTTQTPAERGHRSATQIDARSQRQPDAAQDCQESHG